MSLIIIIIIVTIYAQLGRKMGRSPITWGLVGVGVFVSIQVTGLLSVLIVKDPVKGAVIWQVMYVVSMIGTLGLAFLIAFRNKLIRLKR
jgi:hypothetical protein